jgi:monoterpene epsilon-lactone hydrolase
MVEREIMMLSLRSYIIKRAIRVSAKKVVGKGMEEKRQMLEKVAMKLAKLPKDCKVEPLQVEGMYAEWIFGEGSVSDKVILYLHGGAYGFCSANTHRPLAAGIAHASGVKALLVEYRLAPEHPFPAAIEDAVTSYRWLLNQGYKSTDIIFAGDSAGGGLSIATALVLRDQNEPLPAAIICLSPWVDLTSSGDSYARNSRVDPYLNLEGVKESAQMYVGDEPLDHPLISPVFADLIGLPPLFIQVGGLEILQSDAEMLALQARKAGGNVKIKVWPGMWHVWQLSGNRLPEAKKAINEIGDFVKSIFTKTVI